MSNDYTPSLDNLSLQYALSKDPGDGRTTEEWWAIRDAAQAEFDRAINKIRAEAWQEGYDEFESAHYMSNYEPWEYVGDNPYGEQA